MKPESTVYGQTDLEKAILGSIRRIGRPLSVDELMPLTLPHCPHTIDQSTGKTTYDREAFCKTIQALLSRSQIIQSVNQVHPELVYSLPRT